MEQPTRWEIRRDGMTLGYLEAYDFRQFWTDCKFQPAAAYEDVRAVFEEEARLSKNGTPEEIQKAQECVDSLGLCLYAPQDGTIITDFLLHIDGNEACFRS